MWGLGGCTPRPQILHSEMDLLLVAPHLHSGTAVIPHKQFVRDIKALRISNLTQRLDHKVATEV